MLWFWNGKAKSPDWKRWFSYVENAIRWKSSMFLAEELRLQDGRAESPGRKSDDSLVEKQQVLYRRVVSPCGRTVTFRWKLFFCEFVEKELTNLTGIVMKRWFPSRTIVSILWKSGKFRIEELWRLDRKAESLGRKNWESSMEGISQWCQAEQWGGSPQG